MVPVLTEAHRLAAEMGQRLQWVREAMGLTTTQLGAGIDVDEAMICHIEKGRRGPSVPLIATLCHVLRITPQYLFYGDVRDIDPELRAILLVRHPELRFPTRPQPAGKRSSPRASKAGHAKTRIPMESLPS